MNKKFIFLIGIFLIILVGAVQITTFNGFSSPENLTFTGNENITRSITIFNDGVVSSAFINLSGYNYECYQESANTSNQTGIDGNCNLNYSGNYEVDGTFNPGPVSNGFDGNFNNTARDTSVNQNNSISINYTKPINSISATWKVRHGNVGLEEGNFEDINVSIISTCWNNEPNKVLLRYVADCSGSFCTTRPDWQCYNGTWQSLQRSNINGGFGDIYEESIYWSFYPINISIKINNTNIFSYTGEFNQEDNKTNDFSSTLNTALNSGACDCTGCSLSGNDCTINFIFHSDSIGILNSDLNITWNESTNPNLTISEPSGEKRETGFSYSINASDNYQTDFCTYWVMRGASIEIANVTVSCSTSITGSDTVSSVGTNYTFYFFINDTSGNSNTSTSNFSVVVEGQITGGGGSTTIIIGEGITGWTMESRTGFSRFDIDMPLGTRRDLSVILKNTGSESRDIKLSCEDVNGFVCKYVTFPETPVNLPSVKNQETKPPFIITIPENAELGDFVFNVVGTDDLNKVGKVSVFIEIKESGFFEKLFSRTIGGFPYLIIFLGSWIISLLISMWILGIIKAPLRPLISFISSTIISSVIVIIF